MENNWTIEQTKQLFALANEATQAGKGLVWAFSKMSENSGRSVNSVRNYYYSQLKMFELVPQIAHDLGIRPVSGNRTEFELFTDEQIDALVESILTGKACGKSVRAIIAELSGGDGKKALRLQNKYRSMVAHHRDRVNATMKRLAANGTPYFNPYTKQIMTGQEEPDNYKKLNDYIAQLDETEVSEFLTLMKKLFA